MSLLRQSKSGLTPTTQCTSQTRHLWHKLIIQFRRKAQGKIPGLAPSTVVNGSITYPVGVQPCSFSTTYCRAADGSDLYDAPTGIVGFVRSSPAVSSLAGRYALPRFVLTLARLSFDDGPVAASTVLYNFLTSVQAHATHFMIGSRILEYPQSLQLAVKNGDHVSFHFSSASRLPDQRACS